MHITAFLAVLFLLSAPAAAQGFNVAQPLSFGQFALTAPSYEQTIIINLNGTYSHSPGFLMMTPPVPGHYVITGLPASIPVLGVQITQNLSMSRPDSASLTMDNFQVIHDPATDGGGMLNISIGATLRSQPGGKYRDGYYAGELNVEIQL